MASTTPGNVPDNSEKTVAEFFEEIERHAGPQLTADDHLALVASVRADRERSDD